MNNSARLIKKLTPLFLGLTIIAWGALIRLLFSLLFYLRPLAAEGQPAAILIFVLILPLSFYFLQGLFYMPRRDSGRPVSSRPCLSAAHLVFLPLPFNYFPETNPEPEAAAADEAEKKLLPARAAGCLNISLAGRLALLLNARSPLDLAFKALMKSGFPGLKQPAALLYLMIGPARLLMRLWGYWALVLWRISRDPGGEADEAASLQRAEACEPAARRTGGEEAEPLWRDPRYQGLYLDFPVTWWAPAWEDMYDGGPEEPAALFYPPELAEEVIFLNRLKTEKKFLSSAVNGDALLWLDGRLRPCWEVENEIETLDFEITRQEKRLAAHHRRCRSSSLAAARRKGGDWPGVLRRLGRELFFAERRRPDLKGPILDALLRAEEAVSRGGEIEGREVFMAEAELEGFSGLVQAGSGDETAGEENGFHTPKGRRPDFSADSFGVGFGRSSLVLILLSLLIWQGFSQGTVMLSVYNGLSCQVELSLNGARPLSIPAFGALSSIRIKDRRHCRLKVFSRGQLVEDFLAKPPGPKMIYNIAGAAILVEWSARAGAGEDRFRVLGRSRWLSSPAVFLPADSPGLSEDGGTQWLLVPFGEGRPGKMLALLDDEKDQAALIGVHARWDDPDSPWFLAWTALVGDSGLKAGILMQRLKADPFFLEKLAAAWPGDEDE